MKLFKLPDLGEGLPDAIIREWYVKVGDEVKVDQPLASMETAKALVDVPSPMAGKIEKLFGAVGDTIETGKPLVGFEGEADHEEKVADKGTVVGAIEVGKTVLKESAVGVKPTSDSGDRIKATPAVRALAKKLGVDLASIKSVGDRITAEDVEAAAQKGTSTVSENHLEKLSPVRRAMVASMMRSHQEVVPVSIMDDADIHAWDDKQDPTIRLIRAIAKACQEVPILNAYYDEKSMAYRLNEKINLGIAVDTPHGLYVPVIKNIADLTDEDLRTKINQFKKQAQDKTIPANDLHGTTITLSNFGVFAGRYASPIIIPPTVAIIAVGRARDTVVAFNNAPTIHRVMPISLSFDHRLVTGGEGARFLKEFLQELAKPG